MNRIAYWILLACIASVFSFHDTCFAWNDDKTHITITKKAVEHSVIFPATQDRLKEIGVVSNFKEEILFWPNKVCDEKHHITDCTITDWIAYGAEKEDKEIEVDFWFDTSGRFNNHYLCEAPHKKWFPTAQYHIISVKYNSPKFLINLTR